MGPNLNEDDFDFEAKIKASMRRSHEETADKLMEEARLLMIAAGVHKGDHAFMAHLVMTLKFQASWLIPTAATDGEWLIYNPEYVIKLKKEEVKSLHFSLVLACVLEHQLRRKFRAPEKWGIASALIRNQMLKDLGYPLMPNALLPGEGKFKNLPTEASVEELYRKIPDSLSNKIAKEAQGKGLGSGHKEGQGFDPDGSGGILDNKASAQSEAAQAQQQEQWRRKVAQAEAMGRQRGDLSANLKTFVDKLLDVKINWREVLREFVNKRIKRDYVWNRPHRRYISQGLYFPTKGGETIGRIIVANDTSGSMDWGNARSACATEIQGLVEQIGCPLVILHHDAAVCNVQEWVPEEGPLTLEPRGGGGTSHVPVFEWITKHGCDWEEEVSCIICLTDLYTEFPRSLPELPTLWAVVGNPQGKAPFGQTIHVTED